MRRAWSDKEFATPNEKILEMIVRQCDLREVLQALCLQFGETEQERQIAIFELENDSWSLAAKGHLAEASEDALGRLTPDSLSQLLLRRDASGRGGADFPGGWARHLYSGIGEMLGFVVRFGEELSDWPARPAGDIDALCRLATLAMEQRNLRAELAWQGNHDPVTGLYTPTFFERMLAFELQQTPTPAALLCINIDRFRLVNDVLGHALGNRILKFVGRRFRGCLDPEDVIARGNGDEFSVLLKDGTPQSAADTAGKLLKSLAEPISADDYQVFISASIGIGCAGPGSSGQSLQREAYVALYHAKHDGKARWALFDPSMAATRPERLEMEKGLRSALARKEMLLYYQPQIDLVSGAVAGGEALLRWNPDGLGIISPGKFVPILEETGLIVEFGKWVLREACCQGARWREATGTPFRIGVNVSAVQLRNAGFVDDVRRAVEDAAFPAGLLELELTESVFVGDFEASREILHRLRDLGVVLALDDFGTGQSSLAYLQQLPFHRLKIDQAFVRSIPDGGKCPPMIANIVSLAKSLGMSTIAEGIDHPHQAEVLRAAGCDEGQGYLFSFPIPPDGFLESWLRQGARNARG